MDDLREAEISISEARANLSEVANLARIRDDATVLYNRGKAVAVVVSVDFYEHALLALQDPRASKRSRVTGEPLTLPRLVEGRPVSELRDQDGRRWSGEDS
ncbi:antitoxin Phd_YefM of type II toxin-antitoxin system [Streptomyces sp. TLI_235]|nr:type II toxin-antitoxin system Phd/YefM family antitoxin [Streptomyces sp. TLI_235]PBC71529.1 antitoxin Phd_YefM of type II toxin-antitoxin system [Streptomyces sp. TLI_235]